MGNYKKGSDIDIALSGKRLTESTCNRISGMLNQELPIPFFIEIVNLQTVSNTELKEHIKNYGIVIYRRSEK
jgi:predicted nucleotidyltransferase